jgi:hypothetical protein
MPGELSTRSGVPLSTYRKGSTMAESSWPFDFKVKGIGPAPVEKGDLNIPLPTVRLYVQSTSEVDGAPAISNKLKSETEIDALIIFLKSQLDAVAEHAKRRLQKVNQLISN